MRFDGYQVAHEGIALRVLKATRSQIAEYFIALPARSLKSSIELAAIVKNKVSEKFDPYLTEELLNVGYASGTIALTETATAIGEILGSLEPTGGQTS